MTARYHIYAVPVRRADNGLRQLVTWRLLSGNNRPLGRSPRVFADTAACLSGLDRLRADLDTAHPVTSRTGPAAWTWEVRDAGGVAAVAVRTYQRRIQAQAACDLFLAVAGAAGLTGHTGHDLRARR